MKSFSIHRISLLKLFVLSFLLPYLCWGGATPSPTPTMRDYDCNSICNNKIDPEKSILNPSGKWSSQDDELCSGIKISDGADCSLTPKDSVTSLIDRVSHFSESGCGKLKKIFEHCQNHMNPDQVDTHCKAYKGIKDGPIIPSEITMLTLNAATVASCGTACVCAMAAGCLGASAALETACTVVGLADGATEMGLSMSMTKNGPISEFIETNSVLGMDPASVAMIKVGMTGMRGASALRNFYNSRRSGGNTGARAAQEAAEEASEKAAQEAAEEAAEQAGKKAAQEAAESSAKSGIRGLSSKAAAGVKKLGSKFAKAGGSCASTALAGITLGFRAAAFHKIKEAQAKECEVIKKFSSGAGAYHGSPINSSGGPQFPDATSKPQEAESASSSGATGNPPNLKGFATCMHDGGDASNCAQQNNIPQALAAGALGDAFKDPETTNTLLDKIPDTQTLLDAVNSGDPSAAAASFLPAALKDSEFGAAFAQLGQLIAQNASSLDPIPGILPEGTDLSTYSQASSGAAATDSESGQKTLNFSELLASLGGKSKKDKGKTKEISFQKGPTLEDNSADIWHSKWKGSIFEIITGRLSKGGEWVEKLEWTLTHNRIYQGLKAQPDPAPIEKPQLGKSQIPLILPSK